MTTPSSVIFILDGEKLSHTYQIEPIADMSYGKGGDSPSAVDESEERIIAHTIHPIVPYIKSCVLNEKTTWPNIPIPHTIISLLRRHNISYYSMKETLQKRIWKQ